MSCCEYQQLAGLSRVAYSHRLSLRPSIIISRTAAADNVFGRVCLCVCV